MVIWQHFFGDLGRGKVCASLSPGVEQLSDIPGILFIPLDQNDEWKASLYRELEATGLNVKQPILGNDKVGNFEPDIYMQSKSMPEKQFQGIPGESQAVPILEASRERQLAEITKQYKSMLKKEQINWNLECRCESNSIEKGKAILATLDENLSECRVNIDGFPQDSLP